VSVFRVNADRLHHLKLFGMRVGNYEYSDHHLNLGDLNGNRFTITIRDVIGEDQVIKSAVENLKKNGFVNYYGLQRFGTGTVPTHKIGLALIKKDWSGAAHLILDPRDGEQPQCNAARENYQKTGDIQSTLYMLPKFLRVERQLLEGLRKSGPQSYLNAFSMVPRTMRMMFPHAYQSYVWNRMASERIQMFGFLEPVEGDLIQLDQIDESIEEEVDIEKVMGQVEGQGDAVELEDALEVEDLKQVTYKVGVVTKEDVENKRYSIDQVILPLPGYAVQYPKHSLGQKYRQLLEEDGLDIDNLRRSQKEYSLAGSYRKLIIKPDDLNWKILNYDDFQIPLVLTDNDQFTNAQEPVGVPEGKFKALVLSFNLPPSTYATMLFRELLRIPTTNQRDGNVESHVKNETVQSEKMEEDNSSLEK